MTRILLVLLAVSCLLVAMSCDNGNEFTEDNALYPWLTFTKVGDVVEATVRIPIGMVVIPGKVAGLPVTFKGFADDATRKAAVKVTLSDGLASVADGAFSGCTLLVKVIVPESLLGETASWGLPESVKVYRDEDTIATYTVRFITGGGSVVASQTVEYGKKATKPADPTWVGHIFTGWRTTSEYTTPFDFAGTRIIKTTDVHAKWIQYVKFSSTAPFTLKVYDNTKHWDGTLEYSADGASWTTWAGTETISSSSSGVLYLRGSNNTVITGADNETYRWVLTPTGDASISCTGDIETLLDHAKVAAGTHPTMGDSCYDCLFKDCTSLTMAPELPAETLATLCYADMFNGCTSLTTAPALPAGTLVESCYNCMFQGCTSLTKAQALPAETLAKLCYAGMFYGCTSLTTAPVLPAKTLAVGCYNSMFYGCTSLTTAPSLHAETLAVNCYVYMFRGCTSLTTAPELPAKTLAVGCYNSMFYGCTSLATAPKLPAGTLVQGCYAGMFYGCTSLTTAPALPAKTLALGCYGLMFYGCTSLLTIPALPAKTMKDYCYKNMFSGCSKIKMSASKDATNYPNKYRIPQTDDGTTMTDWNTDMFSGTGGTFTSDPEINTTYYTSNTVVTATP